MNWELGSNGLLYLGAMSIGFGLLAHLLSGRAAPRWLWAVVAAVYFGVGIAVSELWFGDATEAELQPNVDGLSRDEVLGVGLVPVVVAVVATRLRVRRHRHDESETGPTAASRGQPTPHTARPR
jgi:hypothetical protein